MDDIHGLLNNLKQELLEVDSVTSLEQVKIKYLGREGEINKMLEGIKKLPEEKKREYGRKINQTKTEVARLLDQKQGEIIIKVEKEKYIDITLPGKKCPKGSLHLVTIAIEEIVKIFSKLGFIRVSYPEVEWEYFSFEALNMPPNHPARDDFETFFIDAKLEPQYGRMLLTPHTSSGQIREMQRLKTPPIRMINIAKTYRPNWDATHTPMFHQFEGLCIDEGINITHLKGTIDFFAKEFFGPKREIRLRPFHFQFTEPSFEVDVTCGLCFGRGEAKGEKCKVCKAGWLELGGAGMVHPNVLKSGGLDPDKYSGWAFGFGVERPMMMKEGMNLDDIRIIYSGDIRFLEQF
jgi:phenylalanyl-tRNA synthetase alpha chain